MKSQSTNGSLLELFVLYHLFCAVAGSRMFLMDMQLLPFTYLLTCFVNVPCAVILILVVGLGGQNMVWFCTSKILFGFPLRSLFQTWHCGSGDFFDFEFYSHDTAQVFWFI